MIYPEELEGAIEKIEEALRSTGELKYPSRWVALQLLEHDRHLEDEVSELANGKNIIALRDKLEIELREILGDDPQTRIAEERYGFITGAVRETVKYPAVNRLEISDKIDAVLTHRILAYPIFLFFMWLLFRQHSGSVNTRWAG